MAEAHAEHRDLAAAQDVRADAEVVPAFGAARARREDDRVEVPARERPPGDHVVVDHDRLLAGDGREQVEDVVGVGVVVVDQQRRHRLASSPSPRALRSQQRLHDALDVLAAIALQVPAREVLEVVRERAHVEALHREAQVTPVQLRLDDREAIVRVVRRSSAARRRAVTAGALAHAPGPSRGSPRRRSSFVGIEVDPGRDRVGQEVAERDLRRDPFGGGVAARGSRGAPGRRRSARRASR